ncbi:hypothetical protein FVE85_3133 [Porphyridium purpureum]|uniref:Carbohydrate-binding domain-containing protein n=1 Tax=Porphyridium purpureum TaxID=35688 RepID=A0A5J4YVL1_PORPP|nr:hypothetical protein FVE85_3133 [Porphyridium purpureum]|eukprot:POR0956..scf227_4
MTEASAPPMYVCRRVGNGFYKRLDGRVQDSAWDSAAWTDDFVDIRGADVPGVPPPRFRTRAKMVWDDTYFYVGLQMEEPQLWATLTSRNSIIYRDNDIEVFIDPDGDALNYYEFEINALGTIMELTMDRPYCEGGNYTFIETDVLAKVYVHGTINDPTQMPNQGWSVELAFPFATLARYDQRKRASGSPNPRPTAGDEWRVNFSRVQWHLDYNNGRREYVKRPNTTEDNWVWAPTGKIDVHLPHHWGHVVFADDLLP